MITGAAYYLGQLRSSFERAVSEFMTGVGASEESRQRAGLLRLASREADNLAMAVLHGPIDADNQRRALDAIRKDRDTLISYMLNLAPRFVDSNSIPDLRANPRLSTCPFLISGNTRYFSGLPFIRLLSTQLKINMDGYHPDRKTATFDELLDYIQKAPVAE